jgi:ribosomal-protein-alanine N-acetyltransferase
MREFRVRAGTVGDLAEIIALERGVVEAPHWAEAEYVAVVEDGGNVVRRCLFIAEAEGMLVGFAVGKIVDEIAELESVAVSLRNRRGGIGRALCEAVVEWGKGQGAAAVELEVRARSEGPLALYRALGFAAVRLRPRYYSYPADDAVLMRLDLTPSA